MIEQFAIWYLRRRGMFVLPFSLVGFAVGHSIATKTGGDIYYDHWSLVTPKGGKVIAVNNSSVIDHLELRDARDFDA